MERFLLLWDEVDELGCYARFWASGVVGVVSETGRGALGRLGGLIRGLKAA